MGRPRPRESPPCLALLAPPVCYAWLLYSPPPQRPFCLLPAAHRPSSFPPPSQRGCQCPTEEYGLESSNIPIATNTVTQVGNTIYFWPNRLGQNSDRFDFKGPTVVERN